MDCDGKKFAFLGDSIAHHGEFIYNIRSYFHYNGVKATIYNRGISGARVDTVYHFIKEEILSIKPDYCFICFGANDLGIWLYDSFLEIDDKVITDRKERNDKYYNGIKHTVKILKENDIMPIILSPYPVDENITELPDIPTLGDNKEKADLIGPWFYKKQTFRNINDAFSGYASWIKDFAQKENVLFYDNFNWLKKASYNMQNVFGKDGIHYTPCGQALIARGILEFLGFNNIPTGFIKDKENDEILLLEQEERSASFVRFNVFHEMNGSFTLEQMLEQTKTRLKDNNPDWLEKHYNNFIKHFNKFDVLSTKIKDKTNKYLT